jgi:MFS family permease
MSFDSKVTQLGAVSRFCVGRFSDYTELFSIELRQACDRLVRDMIILAALAVAGLFTLAFMCVALIASFWITPYFMRVVWGVAGGLAVTVCRCFLGAQIRRPVLAAGSLRDEVNKDLVAIRQALG